jgi:phosphogluconate dehydratase
MPLNAIVARVTERIVERSRPTRRDYLDRVARARDAGPKRAHLTCGNQAHSYAAMPVADKDARVLGSAGNLGIVTADNDMLSAHQPFETYPMTTTGETPRRPREPRPRAARRLHRS